MAKDQAGAMLPKTGAAAIPGADATKAVTGAAQLPGTAVAPAVDPTKAAMETAEDLAKKQAAEAAKQVVKSPRAPLPSPFGGDLVIKAPFPWIPQPP